MATSFELALDDASPVVNYYPFAETFGAPDLLAGWNSYFSRSGFLSQLGETGLGDSFHITSLDGAILTIQWFGTGISLFGNAVDATYQVSLDGATPSIGLPRQDLLAKFEGLETKQHLVALIAHPNAAAFNTSSHVAFDRATLKVQTDRTGAIISSEDLDVASPRWIFSGDWSDFSDPVALSQLDQLYRVCHTRGATASIIFTGSAVSLTGLRNDTHGHYNVTLDGVVTMFDGHSDWLEPASTLFLQAGLDETVQHTLTVTNADDSTLALSGLNVTHVNGGTLLAVGSGSSISTGTVIGVVFAILLGLLALTTLGICIYLRRRNRRLIFINGNNDTRWRIRGRRTMHASKASKYSLQELYTGETADIAAGPDDEATHGDSARSPIMRVTQRQEDMIDPTSPIPYIRSSKIQSSANIYNLAGRGRSLSERDSRSNTVVQAPFAATAHPLNDTVDSSESQPGTSHSHSRIWERGTDTRSLHRLHVEIPSISSSAGERLGGTPQHRSAVLSSSPRRDIHRSPLRNSATVSYNPALPSVSTMQFSTPWDGRRESGSMHTETTITAEEENVSFSARDVPMDLLERLRTRKAQVVAVPSGRSNWNPPW